MQLHELAGLHPAILVLEELQGRFDPEKPPMLIGAEARTILHHAQGHEFDYTSTRDLDLTFAVPSWESYAELTNDLTRIPDSGIAFRIAGMHVDLMPFGGVEADDGALRPPWRPRDPMDVFAMSTVYAGSDSIRFEAAPTLSLRIPTLIGYAALKLKAWIDRAARQEFKDGPDLGLVLYWYSQSDAVRETLYTRRADLLERSDFDLQLASAMLLGADIRDLLSARQAELMSQLWTGESRARLVDNLASRDNRVRLNLVSGADREALINAVWDELAR